MLLWLEPKKSMFLYEFLNKKSDDGGTNLGRTRKANFSSYIHIFTVVYVNTVDLKLAIPVLPKLVTLSSDVY